MNTMKTDDMTLINLTPHALVIWGTDGILTIPQSGDVARLTVTRTEKPPINSKAVEIRISLPVMGEIVGIPAPVAGVIYVVSALVAEKAKRADVMSPGELKRDPQGRVIGAWGLCAYV